jgi:MSHA biogenesis protein MshI
LTEGEPERRRQMQERLALEVQRTLDNFDRQYGFISVSRLLVASEQNTAELVATLGESIYIPALVMDLASVLDFAAVPELRQPARQVQGLLAIGAALRESA